MLIAFSSVMNSRLEASASANGLQRRAMPIKGGGGRGIWYRRGLSQIYDLDNALWIADAYRSRFEPSIQLSRCLY